MAVLLQSDAIASCSGSADYPGTPRHPPEKKCAHQTIALDATERETLPRSLQAAIWVIEIFGRLISNVMLPLIS